MSEMDNTYAEKFPGEGGRDSSKIYATAIDDSTAAATVAALTSNAAYLEALTDKMAGDDEFFPALIAALVADGTYPAALGDALMADTGYLDAIGDNLEGDVNLMGAVAAAVEAAMVVNYQAPVTVESLVPDVAYDGDPATTASHAFDPLAQLGDEGIVPGSVTATFTIGGGPQTFTDPGSDGVLVGSVDGTGSIAYDTGVISITWGVDSPDIGTTGTIDYANYVHAFEPEVVLSPASLLAIADELEGDTNFLEAVADAVLAASAAANPVVDDVDFTIGVDGGDNSIDVTIQLLDAEAANFAERTMVSVWWCSDADATVPVGPTGIGGITTEGTAGGVLEEITTGKSYQCVTDEAGSLALTLADDDATGDLTSYLGVMLPNGKYVVGGAMVFNPS